MTEPYTHTYNAVVVCNGHYAVPRVPPVTGMDSFGGRCEHSHNYRRPDGYRGLRVVTVGAHASGAMLPLSSDLQRNRVVYPGGLGMACHYVSPRCDWSAARSLRNGVGCREAQDHIASINFSPRSRVRSAGEDIARDVAACAREVIMSAKTWMKPEFERDRGPFGLHGNMYRRSWPKELCRDGSVVFEDGSRVEHVDVVMFCTGAQVDRRFWRVCIS